MTVCNKNTPLPFPSSGGSRYVYKWTYIVRLHWRCSYIYEEDRTGTFRHLFVLPMQYTVPACLNLVSSLSLSPLSCPVFSPSSPPSLLLLLSFPLTDVTSLTGSGCARRDALVEVPHVTGSTSREWCSTLPLGAQVSPLGTPPPSPSIPPPQPPPYPRSSYRLLVPDC